MKPSYPVIGIDVSKNQLDVARHGQARTRRFANDQNGIAALIKAIAKTKPQRVVLEATGGYERRLVAALHAADMPVAVVNPKCVRNFAKALGVMAKSDQLDARVIAHFAHSINPDIDEKPDENQLQRADLVTRRRQLVKMRTAETNRLQQTDNPIAIQSIQQMIQTLNQQISQIEEMLEQATRDDPKACEKCRKLQQVQGVGKTTAHTLVNQLPELGAASRAQIAALVGLAPYDCDSGKWRGKRAIRGGRAEVRAALYMATFNAIRCNPVIRAYFERLTAKGKLFKVAMVACMRKLLIYLNSILAETKNHTANA